MQDPLILGSKGYQSTILSYEFRVVNCTPYISKYVSFVITKFENMNEKQTIFL